MLLLLLIAVHTGFYYQARHRHAFWMDHREQFDTLTSALGLTDLCLATESRYTRHPAVSDPLAPFMDGPDSLEHFPTGSFWAYPGVVGEGNR